MSTIVELPSSSSRLVSKAPHPAACLISRNPVISAMVHHTARSGTTNSSSAMQIRGRTKSPVLATGRRAQSPTLTSGAMTALNNARGPLIPSLSPERPVEDHLYHGMLAATRYARGSKFIVERLSAFQADQHDGRLVLTREEVSNIVASILGTIKVAAHDILSMGVKLLEFAPIPGMASVGEALLSIWEAIEQVHANQHACKKLAEHCVVIASFVRDEVYDTTGFVSEDLRPSIAKLNRVLREVEAFIKEQALQTRTHEFLTRRSIKNRIEEIQGRLTQTFQYFNYVIPVQIMHFLLREIHPATENHNPETIAPPPTVIITHPLQSSHGIRQPPQGPPRMETTVLEIRQTQTESTVQEVTHNRYPADTARPSIVSIDGGRFASNVAHSDNGHATSTPTAAPPCAGKKHPDIPRLYASLVKHEFGSLLLTMPLWTPTPVHVGAVGYYSRADGGFVTLFNARAPPNTADVAKLSIEAFQHERASYTGRPYKFALQASKPAAYLYTEKTMYRCFKDLGAAGDWLLDNADKVISSYGRPGQHPVDQKRLTLVTGTMAAQDHALCVCPNAPRSNGTISFHRHKAKPGQPWGQWSQKASPDGTEPVVSKVSTVKAAREPWDTVLLSVLSYHHLMNEGAQ